MRKILLVLIGVVIICHFHSLALSWDNEKTHQDLSEVASYKSIIGTTNYLKNIGLKEGLLHLLKLSAKQQEIYKWIREGVFLEDAGNIVDLSLGRARSYNHFHNPLKPWDIAGLNDYYIVPNPYPPFIPITYSMSGESALMWAQDQEYQKKYTNLEGDQTWQAARNYFYTALTGKTDAERQENFARTFKGLVHQMHLIQDMAVPAHARNDAHVGEGVQDWLMKKNVPSGDLYFETWAKKYYPIINTFASTPIFPQVDLTKNPGGKIPITQFYDTDQYNENVVPTKSLTWGLSEYTNANFVSDDTIFTENLSKNDGHYFPYPRYTDQNQCYEQFDETYVATNKKRTYWRKKCVGEAVEHFLTAGPLFKYLPMWDLQRLTLKLDEATHYDYASKLIPRAVGYSAGLLNYFFRGDMEVVKHEVVKDGSGDITNIKMKVKNLTQDETMGPQKDPVTGQIKGQGKFIISYQYKISGGDVYGTSNETQLNENINPGKESTSEFSFNFTPSIPSNAEDIKYWLVYRGRLGNEEDAVAGKTVELREPDYLFLAGIVYPHDIRLRLFTIVISNGSYQLIPIEREINIEGTAPEISGASVQSNDLHDKHFVTLASWSPKIGQWGVDSGTLGCYRPENFDENAAYKYFQSDEDLPELQQGWHKYCTGRHNFTVQDSILRTHSETVAVKSDAKPSLYGKGQDGWELLSNLPEETRETKENISSPKVQCTTESSGEFVNPGESCPASGWPAQSKTTLISCNGGYDIAGNEVPLEYVYTGTSNNNTPYFKAAIGAGKVIILSEEDNQETKSVQRILWKETTINRSWVSIYKFICYIGSIQDAEYRGSSVSRLKEIMPYYEVTAKYTFKTTLEIGDYEIDNALYSKTEEAISYNEEANPGWVTQESYSHIEAGGISPPCRTCWYAPLWGPPVVTETTIINEDPYVKKRFKYTYDGGRMELVDYDNLNGDASFICIYSKSNIHSVWEGTEGEGEDEEESFTAPTETIEYFLAYKVKGEGTIHKVSLGQNIKYTSCQMDDKTMVYTYIVENNGIFNKRVVGVLNNSDSALPMGYRQEFELGFSGTDFDPEGLVAIGVTR